MLVYYVSDEGILCVMIISNFDKNIAFSKTTDKHLKTICYNFFYYTFIGYFNILDTKLRQITYLTRY